MRLSAAGTPGQSEPGSIIHFYHFRHWRLTGIAFEVRNCTYNSPNMTLLSTAKGRTREFKDRCSFTAHLTQLLCVELLLKLLLGHCMSGRFALCAQCK
jgi:hypothetical protein